MPSGLPWQTRSPSRQAASAQMILSKDWAQPALATVLAAALTFAPIDAVHAASTASTKSSKAPASKAPAAKAPVSYTHLTLPTICSV
eukprot:2795617-Prymnesium_polylepis.1